MHTTACREFHKNVNHTTGNRCASAPAIMISSSPPSTKLLVENSLESAEYDGIVFVSSPGQNIRSAVLRSALDDALKCDPSLKTEIGVIPVNLPAGRIVLSPTGPLDPDYDDVRELRKSAAAGVKRALKAGVRRPLLVVEEGGGFERAALVTVLGALEALYTPIQVREHDKSKTQKIEHLGIFTHNIDQTKELINLATILEQGRRVACDIGDADPERMAPPRVEEYVTKLFANTSVKVNVISDVQQLAKEYPLFEAVNRAASQQKRHEGRIIYLEYNPQNAKETLFIVGKGVTYDTGGADVKVGGAMLGMSRDKCGAAAVAGFMYVVEQLKPNIRVVSALSVVRNSIGSNSYVADEVITARSGARVRIINTDAEGRMVMADVLCRMKELAVNAINPHLFTIATLTGHAARTVGEGYSIVMDNGPARKAGNDKKLQEASQLIGDPFEISIIRKEDFLSHRGVSEGDDVVQGQSKPSTLSERGHQGPAAFLILASGLDKHGSGSDKPLKYSHLDIAASAGSLPNPATGSPVLALAQAYLL